MKRREEIALKALISCRTVREASKISGLSERSIYNYLSNPIFKAAYEAAKTDIIRGVAANLRERMSEAADVVGAVMSRENRPRDRLAAAKIALTFSIRLDESLDFSERLAELEKKLNGEKN